METETQVSEYSKAPVEAAGTEVVTDAAKAEVGKGIRVKVGIAAEVEVPAEQVDVGVTVLRDDIVIARALHPNPANY